VNPEHHPPGSPDSMMWRHTTSEPCCMVQSERMLGPRGGGVGGTPSRAGLPRTLSQEALREVAASLTLMTNVTDNPSRCDLYFQPGTGCRQSAPCICLTPLLSNRPIKCISVRPFSV